MKDNNKKKDIKKIIAAIVMAITIILIIIVIALLLYKINTNKEDEPGIVNEKNIPIETAKELFNNSYLVGYLLEGDIKTGEGKLVNENNHLTYYAVTDENLKDFKSTEDIMKMIFDTFPEDRAAAYARFFYGFDNSKYNVYTSFEDTLYVLKTPNICKGMPSSINLKDLKVQMVDDTAVFILGDVENRAYKNVQENRWNMSSVSYTCSLYSISSNDNLDNPENPNDEENLNKKEE